MATMAAVDLGAQSGRVATGRFDGSRLEVREVHRFANDPIKSGGSLCWDAEQLRRDILDGLRAAGLTAAVDSLAVDSWGVDFGLLNAKDELVQPARHYRDGRRAAAPAGVFGRVA